MSRSGHSVGIDLVRVADVAGSIARFGDRYLERIFTPAEIEYCRAVPSVSAQRFAARFAAKEAARKALRVPDEGMGWRTVEVRRGPDGACTLRLSGAAVTYARRAGVTALAVSMSHETEYATAIVVADTTTSRRGTTTRARRLPASMPAHEGSGSSHRQ